MVTPRHSNPLVQQIDAEFDTLDPIFKSFAATYSYEFCKSVDGDFFPPHRSLLRIIHSGKFHYGIDFRILREENTNTLPVFSPDIPCVMKVLASAFHEDGYWKTFREVVFLGLPFSRLHCDLESFLVQAHIKLEEWTYERIIAEGINENT